MRKLTQEEREVLALIDGKICLKCKVFKKRNEYEFSGYNADKMKSYCHICRVEYDSAKRRERKSKDFLKYSLREKNRKLKIKYNITLEDYENLLKEQDYKCKICNIPYTDSKKTNLYVDHCHTTSKVRGLICNSCNKGLGDFKDNINLLKNAIKYLEEN